MTSVTSVSMNRMVCMCYNRTSVEVFLNLCACLWSVFFFCFFKWKKKVVHLLVILFAVHHAVMDLLVSVAGLGRWNCPWTHSRFQFQTGTQMVRIKTGNVKAGYVMVVFTLHVPFTCPFFLDHPDDYTFVTRLFTLFSIYIYKRTDSFTQQAKTSCIVVKIHLFQGWERPYHCRGLHWQSMMHIVSKTFIITPPVTPRGVRKCLTMQ